MAAALLISGMISAIIGVIAAMVTGSIVDSAGLNGSTYAIVSIIPLAVAAVTIIAVFVTLVGAVSR